MTRHTPFIRSHGHDPRGPDADARSRRAAQRARAQATHDAVLDESARLNAAIEQGAVAVLDTAFGPHQVDRVTGDLWVMCYPVGMRPGAFTSRSFALANDGTWADLLEQAGVARHPLFTK